MPKAYFIFTEDINDPDAMGEYAQGAVPTVFASGGSIVVAGPAESVIEGQWHGNQIVILEFESVEAAHAWYDSPAYQAIIGKRHAAAQSNAVVVPGFEMPTS